MRDFMKIPTFTTLRNAAKIIDARNELASKIKSQPITNLGGADDTDAEIMQQLNGAHVFPTLREEHLQNGIIYIRMRLVSTFGKLHIDPPERCDVNTQIEFESCFDPESSISLLRDLSPQHALACIQFAFALRMRTLDKKWDTEKSSQQNHLRTLEERIDNIQRRYNEIFEDIVDPATTVSAILTA